MKIKEQMPRMAIASFSSFTNSMDKEWNREDSMQRQHLKKIKKEKEKHPLLLMLIICWEPQSSLWKLMAADFSRKMSRPVSGPGSGAVYL